MILLFGCVLIALTCVMIWLAIPAKGADSAAFLRVWLVAQIYAMAAMISAVVGVTLIISDWPL